MVLWRISNFADLAGTGGLRAAGRWHYRGQPVVYLAEHPALALLETLVHHEVRTLAELPDTYQLLRIEVPDALAVAELPDDAVPPDWRENTEWAQSAGSEWLAAGQELLLRVPSAILPYSRNYLFNPMHRDAGQASIAEALRVPYDPRVLQLLGGA